MENIKLDELIGDIVDRMLGQAGGCMREDETVRGTLAVLAGYAPAGESAVQALLSRYGRDVEFALLGEVEFETSGFFRIRADDAATRNQLLKNAEKKERIVLVAPKISLLEKIVLGDDQGFMEYIFLRSLLWGRKPCVLLDFERPKFKRGTFFEKVSDILEMLESMGVEITHYACAEDR